MFCKYYPEPKDPEWRTEAETRLPLTLVLKAKLKRKDQGELEGSRCP